MPQFLATRSTPRPEALPAQTYQRPAAALDVALADLPLELLKRLELGRPMLNHRDDRPACAEAPSTSFDRLNHAVSTGRRVVEVPQEIKMAAKLYCGECPIMAECAAWADTKREEGLWGGSYRVKLSNKDRTRNYLVLDLLPELIARPAS